MAPRRGPTAGPALILLCFLGTLLSARAASVQQPPSPEHQWKQLCWLWNSASTLYANYSRVENLRSSFPHFPQRCPSTRPPLPGCVASGAGGVEPASFLPFVRHIKPTVLRSLPRNHDVDEIIDVLERLQVGEVQDESVNTSMSSIEKKWLVLSVLMQLVECVKATGERTGDCGHIPDPWEGNPRPRAVSWEPHPKKVQTRLRKSSKASQLRPRPPRLPG